MRKTSESGQYVHIDLRDDILQRAVEFDGQLNRTLSSPFILSRDIFSSRSIDDRSLP